MGNAVEISHGIRRMRGSRPIARLGGGISTWTIGRKTSPVLSTGSTRSNAMSKQAVQRYLNELGAEFSLGPFFLPRTSPVTKPPKLF